MFGKTAAGFDDADELLLGTCDGLRENSGAQKTYPTVVRWTDVISLRILSSAPFCLVTAMVLMLLSKHVWDETRPPFLSVFFSGFAVAMVLAVGITIAQTPRRIVREAESFVVESYVRRHVVPIDDVLELVVLNNGKQLYRLLRRWEIFPHGWKRLSVFSGSTPVGGHVCVLLTRRLLWSYAFAIEDPVQFLLDNQKPLDLKAFYQTTSKAALRADEATDSEKVGAVPKGRRLRVLEQRGRRVLVQVENCEESAWMSYISAKGRCLLAKEQDLERPVAGSIGASEISRSTDVALELGMLRADHPDAIE